VGRAAHQAVTPSWKNGHHLRYIEKMQIRMALGMPDGDAEAIQELTRALAATLAEETNSDAQLDSSPPEKGARGDSVTLGVIVMSVLSSGTAVAVINVLKAFFDRKDSLSIELERGDGRKMKLSLDQGGRKQFEQTLQAAKQFFTGN
jgi:hypothetical protein